MIRVPGRPVSLTRRTIPIGVVSALLAVAMLAFLVPSAAAAPVAPHFGPNVQIDVPPVYRASFFGPSPSIAAGTNGVVFLAFAGWSGSTTGDDIDFTMSSDGGRSWSTPIRVNDDAGAAAQAEPSLALDPSNNIYIVWTDMRSGNNDVYFAKSVNGGLTFGANLRVNDITTNSQSEPDLAVDPVNPHLVHVVWTDTRSPILGPDIFYANPTIAVDLAGTIYVAWTDGRNANTAPDIYEAWSANAGASFGANVQVNDDRGLAPQLSPSLVANAGKIQIAWADYRTGGSTNYDIYTASSEDGISWSPNMKVNDDTLPNNFQMNPIIAVDAAGDVFAAFLDSRAIGWDVYAATLDVVAPTANAGSAVTGDQSANLVFDGSGSPHNLRGARYTPDFGDGATASRASGTHVYATPGGYTATLTVWDDSGNTATDTRSVTVRDIQAPVPHGTGDRTVDESQSLYFDASASTDDVGATSYRSDFWDSSSASTAAASHVYARPGAYTASLTVMDAAGNSATSTFSVTVRAVSPKASDLLGMIQILEAIIALLAAALAFVGWLLLGMRKREQRPPVPASARPMTPRREPMPPLPQAQPPRETDPLDMTFPPTPPNGP